MRLIMMGTGGFAVPTFRALYATPHQVVALVTQPLRSVHAAHPPAVPPLREVALEHGTPILDPPCINTEAAREDLRRLAPDLFIVADYGQILSSETLAVARHGGVNLHGSLLPQYRGAAPINWAIYHGESETGVTTLHITPKVDAGPLLAQAKTAIGPEETAVALEARLAQLGAPLVVETIAAIERGDLHPLPQDPAAASRAPRLKKTDGLVDWTRPAQAIKNQVRALEPWPKTYSFWQRPDGPPLRVILQHVVARDDDAAAAQPGTVLAAQPDELVIAAGQGSVAIERIQPEAKRAMSADEFLRGYPVRPGQRFAGPGAAP